jgi:hypothetical protein
MNARTRVLLTAASVACLVLFSARLGTAQTTQYYLHGEPGGNSARSL